MDNKELDEILQNYAESTRNDREVALKKLNDNSPEVRRPSKRVKFRYVFAGVMCAIILVLCIALPITLPQDYSGTNDAPRYCYDGDISLRGEESLAVVINDYGINAYYPTYMAAPDHMSATSILSLSDPTLHGVLLGLTIDDPYISIEIAIVPKTHILATYKTYFELPDELQWNEFKLLYSNEFNTWSEFYDIKIYFTDGKYDYFITALSFDEIATLELLDIFYG